MVAAAAADAAHDDEDTVAEPCCRIPEAVVPGSIDLRRTAGSSRMMFPRETKLRTRRSPHSRSPPLSTGGE